MKLELQMLVVALGTATVLNAGVARAIPVLELAPYCAATSSIDNSSEKAAAFVKSHSNADRLKAIANMYAKECTASKGTITNHLTQANFDFGKINMMCLGPQTNPAVPPEVTSRAFLFDRDGHMKTFDLGNDCVNRVDFEKEAKNLDRFKAESQAEEARLTKEENIRIAAERQQYASFRKSLKEGDETNCGLVIEKKGKLAKIQLSSSNTEKWFKVENIFPAGHSCIDDEQSVAAPAAISHTTVGQKVCKNIQVTKDYALRKYTETVNLTGFVENSSGPKIQIRISGIVSNGSEITPRGTNLDRINGDVILENGSIIWDEASSWNSCN